VDLTLDDQGNLFITESTSAVGLNTCDGQTRQIGPSENADRMNVVAVASLRLAVSSTFVLPRREQEGLMIHWPPSDEAEREERMENLEKN
jgi:hypothetical protein